MQGGVRRGAGILKEEGRLRDQTWLMDRLRTAAGRRYHRLHRNCVKRITENGAWPVPTPRTHTRVSVPPSALVDQLYAGPDVTCPGSRT